MQYYSFHKILLKPLITAILHESAKLRTTRALMPYVPRALRALVPHVPRVICALALDVPRASRASYLMCSCASLVLRTLLPHVSCALHFLVLLCLVPYVLFCSSSLTCFSCFKPNILICISCFVTFMSCGSLLLVIELFGFFTAWVKVNHCDKPFLKNQSHYSGFSYK